MRVHKVLAIIGLCWASAAASAASVPAELGVQLVQNYIAPSTEAFHRSAMRMRDAISAYCAAPAPHASGDVRSAFENLVESWSKVEFLRFGPLVSSNRFERIYFWPDPRGTTVRQANKLLSNPSALEPKALAANSVAAQGLPALEYLLYREGNLLAAPDRAAGSGACAYANSLAVNLSIESGKLARAWDAKEGDYARQFYLEPADEAIYRTTQEVAAEAIKSISSGLQSVRDIKLAPMLGKDASSANLKRAPFWRSGLSARAMAANIKGMLDFYSAGGWEYAANERWLDDSLRHELEQAYAIFREDDRPMEARLNEDESRRQLQLAVLVLDNAKSVLDGDLAPAFGIRIGFNALDGD